ncbi:zinc finger protein Helios-like [Stegodyphus dumicola]|uniref:zinc finger protein Helios-like n=1 Tax=Stegodyphus dumicola TaxID=202533 RepID=UPI0015A8E8B7|nr:zinc finger protein Helios-like [Stegodyphus dumicola]XP_035206453.1 zinc finger protein Helios-like [Stegodyphus dumicola]
MDESLPSNENSKPDAIPPDQTEHDDDRAHSASPERQQVETENVISPVLNEVAIDNRHGNSVDEGMDTEERPVNRDINEGFLDAEEVMIQRHAMLSSDMISQENESSFSCKYPGCNFTCTDVELYLKHEDTHVDGGTVVCDVCNMRFATYANMRRHRLLHLGVRPFECQTCSKRFLRKDQFTEHLSKHSKQRPYRCPFCSRSFSFRPHLKSHLSSEHANIVLDKTCRLCDFKASSPSGAKVHFAMCHLKQTLEASDVESDRSHELIGSSQAHASQTENGAIDLATVSQNFSFMAATYPPFPATASDNSVVVPGPSDLSRTSSKVIRMPTPVSGPRGLIHHNIEQNMVMPMQEEEKRHTCVSSLAGSTTVVSPTTCQDRPCCRPEVQRVDFQSRDRVCVKPEPPELSVDDSQNSNVQPTSTMDLSTTDVVETTCVSAEASGSSEIPCRRKSHKHSSGEDTGSENHSSPSNRNCLDSQSVLQPRIAHTCYRLRQCEDSGSQRCREYSRHTCVSHRHNQAEKRPRFSESDGDRNIQNDHSDGEERKVFYNRATSTNSLIPTEIHAPRILRHASSTLHNDSGACASESRAESNYFGRKSTIVIRDIESCTLTCPYCGIIFPDQTLYFLHRSLHSEASPWKCNLCGKSCKDKYDFNSHVISKGHY